MLAVLQCVGEDMAAVDRLLISALTVALLGTIITSDHPDRLDDLSVVNQVVPKRVVNHIVPKRETQSCQAHPCASPSYTNPNLPIIVSAAVVGILILSGIVCFVWQICVRGKSQRLSTQTSTSNISVNYRTPTKATPRASVNFDLDIPNNELYSSDDDDSVLEGPDFSMMESYNVEPVAACSPYHLAWTTPHGRRSKSRIESVKEDHVCTCTVINECVDQNQNSKPECDQELKLQPDATSISSSTPYRTPRVGYAKGRPCPTPIERLTSIKPGTASPATKVLANRAKDTAITPKKLFLDKRRQGYQTPVQRILEIPPKPKSDEGQSTRTEDSLLWDSYPFRPSEESLVWDDYLPEKSKVEVDDNCNDPNFVCLEEGRLHTPRSVRI